MTDEQLEQNAIMAAVNFKDWHHPQMSFHDGYIAGAKKVLEKIEEEMPLISLWFGYIAQLATDKKTANGFVMSDSDTFAEITALAKRSQEYIKLHLYDK